MSRVADIVELDEERVKRSTGNDTEFSGEFEHAGEMLAAARIDAGLSIETVSEGTNIRDVHLQSIEAMAIDHLPIAAYTTGFVKTYAEFLGLPVAPLVERFRREAGYVTPTIAPDVQIPVRQELAGGRELSLLAVILILGFVLWVGYKITRQPDPAAPVVLPQTPLQERPADMATQDVQETVSVSGAIAPATPSEADIVTSGETDTTAPASSVTDKRATDMRADGQPSVTTGPTLLPTEVDEQPGATSAENNTDLQAGEALDDIAETTLAESEEFVALNEETVAENRDSSIASAPSQPLEALLPENEVDIVPLNENLVTDPSEPFLQNDVRELNLEQSETVLETSPAAPVVEPIAEQDQAEQALEEAITPNVTPVTILSSVPPAYPYRCEKRAADIEKVVVGYDVNRAGRVINPRIISSSNNCFDKASLNAVGRWRFTPAMRDGIAEPTYGRTTSFRFDLPE
ncbi:MAG: TonB family protein [bacterium]